MTQKIQFVLPLLACLFVGACGQKGPLFLPGDKSRLHTELPEIDREALEGVLKEDDEEGARVPDTERPQSSDDEAEPYIDPASPPSTTNDHDQDDLA